MENGIKKSGLKGEYFNNISLTGKPVLVRTDSRVNFNWTLYSPDPKINYNWFSVRWTGSLICPAAGDFHIGVKGDDGYRLYINNKLILDMWKKQTYGVNLSEYHFEKGREYDIKLEFYETLGNVRIFLVWDAGLKKNFYGKIAEAVRRAEKSDVAVVAAGINEGEGHDRAFLSLPGLQEEMIRKIAETGTPVVVIITAGSAVTMARWIDKVSSILDVWYPGEQGGNAVAKVLFGDYNPGGRLPITFPYSEGQVPLYYNHKPTGRLDDYSDLTGKPLFPFGFGLSYTDFEYSGLKISPNEISHSDTSEVSFFVRNTGKIPGDEVVQLYIKDIYASLARPVMELKGFKRVHLEPGRRKRVSFTIFPYMLSMLNRNLKRVVEPGKFRIMIGASSRDIRLQNVLIVK